MLIFLRSDFDHRPTLRRRHYNRQNLSDGQNSGYPCVVPNQRTVETPDQSERTNGGSAKISFGRSDEDSTNPPPAGENIGTAYDRI